MITSVYYDLNGYTRISMCILWSLVYTTISSVDYDLYVYSMISSVYYNLNGYTMISMGILRSQWVYYDLYVYSMISSVYYDLNGYTRISSVYYDL